MSATFPRVSVLLPVRNGMPWLRTAMASILTQSFRDLELIVLEDGSTDQTPGFLRTVDDPRLRVIDTGGVGIAGALNRGLEVARGEIIARQDADDESLRDRLRRQIAVLEARPEIDLVATTATYIDRDAATVDNVWVQQVRRQHDVATTPAAIAALLPLTCCVTHGSIAARAATLRDAGGYHSWMTPAEDYDLWLRLLPRHRFSKLSEPLYRYRIHDGQSTARARFEQTRQAVLAKLLYVRRSVSLPSPARLALAGDTAGDTVYQAVASDADFRIVSGNEWDVLVITDFDRLDWYRHQAVQRLGQPATLLGNFVVRQLPERSAHQPQRSA